MPAGIVIVTVRDLRSVPTPRHSGQGFSMISPSPLQLGHVEAMEKNPEFLRTWPEPPHVGQSFLPLPFSAPIPLQAPHFYARAYVTSFFTPKAASRKVISMS
jgi:hypothetical protein